LAREQKPSWRGGQVDHFAIEKWNFQRRRRLAEQCRHFRGGVEKVLSGGFLSGQVYPGSGNYGESILGTLNISIGGSGAFPGVSVGGIINVARMNLSNASVISGGIENVLSGGLISGSTSTIPSGGDAVIACGIVIVITIIAGPAGSGRKRYGERYRQ
jgi:hypothetical protein